MAAAVARCDDALAPDARGREAGAPRGGTRLASWRRVAGDVPRELARAACVAPAALHLRERPRERAVCVCGAAVRRAKAERFVRRRGGSAVRLSRCL